MSVTIDTTAPVAPSIATFSTDSGVVGDHITNDNTLTLTGTAEANSVVKVYDGATLLNSVTADGTGAWSYTTMALSNGTHSLTATATDAAGNTGVASAALSVTVDTVAPTVPLITSDVVVNTNQIALTGTAEANSVVKVYDGATLLNSVTADGTGAWNYTTAALANGTHNLTATATDAAGNAGVASSVLEVVVDLSATVIEAVGSTSLVEVGTNFFLDKISSGSGSALTLDNISTGSGSALTLDNFSTGAGPTLKYAGADVVAGEFGAGWTPIGTEQTAPGYEVAWKNDAGQYSIWNTDSNGNFISTTAAMSASNNMLETSETGFHQDLNGDGTIGVPTNTGPTTVIELVGSTSLVEVGTDFYLDNISTGVGPSLKYGGADVVAGQFGAGWTPIGTEQTATGYEVAWKNDTGQYSVWNTDSNGNFISTTAAMSATNNTLETSETGFHQDLNGDGTIGVPTSTGPTTVIDSVGSTSLVEVGTNYFLDNISTGAGPSLKYGGADVDAGQFGAGWTPIGAEQTATGYEVAWKNDAGQYSVWNTDSNGNFVSTTAAMSPSNPALESSETGFLQDLNGNGLIGGKAIVNGTSGNDTLVSSSPNQIFFGNGGSNTFVFSGTIGNDIIADFHPNNDAVQLSKNTFATFADMMAHAAQVGSDVTITIDAADSVTLHNTTVAQLNSNNFHLV